MKTKRLIAIFLFLISGILFAQEKYLDQLILLSGASIKCEVREIGDDEIKYAQEGFRSNVLMGIDKNKVLKIVFADGREMIISNSMTQSPDYDLQHRNVLKFNFLSPAAGAYAVSFERSIKPGQSFETELGIISNGDADENNMEATGFFLKAGFKFIRDPDFYLKGMRYAHILKGSYIKPELAIASFSYDHNTTFWGSESVNVKGTTTKLAVLLNAGKQVVYSNKFAVDFFCSVGYLFGGGEKDIRYFAFTGSDSNALTFSGGIRLGFLF
ncbi:MAG: hypothetical protein WAO52_06025 [Prolixibacteraceae bacterium]